MTVQTRHIRYILLIAAVLIALLVLLLATGGDNASREPERVASSASPEAASAQSRQAVRTDHYADPVSSIFDHRGEDIEGELLHDGDGNLLVTLDARILFDYFIMTYVQANPATGRNAFYDYVESALPEPARSQAIKLFDDYLSYMTTVNDVMLRLEAAGGDMAFMAAQRDMDSQRAYFDEIEGHLNELELLRQQFFDAGEQDAFFGVEEAYSRYTLSRMRLNADTDISDYDRQLAIAELQAALPPEIREFEQQSDADFELFEKTMALRESGAGEDEIRALRESYVGAEVAEQMARFEAEQAQWEERYDVYNAEAQAIRQNVLLDEVTREEEIGRLRNAHFDPQEMSEVELYDQAQLELDELDF